MARYVKDAKNVEFSKDEMMSLLGQSLTFDLYKAYRNVGKNLADGQMYQISTRVANLFKEDAPIPDFKQIKQEIKDAFADQVEPLPDAEQRLNNSGWLFRTFTKYKGGDTIMLDDDAFLPVNPFDPRYKNTCLNEVYNGLAYGKRNLSDIAFGLQGSEVRFNGGIDPEHIMGLTRFRRRMQRVDYQNLVRNMSQSSAMMSMGGYIGKTTPVDVGNGRSINVPSEIKHNKAYWERNEVLRSASNLIKAVNDAEVPFDLNYDLSRTQLQITNESRSVTILPRLMWASGGEIAGKSNVGLMYDAPSGVLFTPRLSSKTKDANGKFKVDKILLSDASLQKGTLWFFGQTPQSDFTKGEGEYLAVGEYNNKVLDNGVVAYTHPHALKAQKGTTSSSDGSLFVGYDEDGKILEGYTVKLNEGSSAQYYPNCMRLNPGEQTKLFEDYRRASARELGEMVRVAKGNYIDELNFDFIEKLSGELVSKESVNGETVKDVFELHRDEFSTDEDVAKLQRDMIRAYSAAELGRKLEIAELEQKAESGAVLSDEEQALEQNLSLKDMFDHNVEATFGNFQMEVNSNAQDINAYTISYGGKLSPVIVARYADRSVSPNRNLNKVMSLMRFTGLDETALLDSVRTETTYGSKMVRFNEPYDETEQMSEPFDLSKAEEMYRIRLEEEPKLNQARREGTELFELANSQYTTEQLKFYVHLKNEMQKSLATSGVILSAPQGATQPHLLIDDHGVISWSGYVAANGNGSEKAYIHGEIGQFFPPDDLGVVVTNFKKDPLREEENNFAFVPGYTGRIIDEKDGEKSEVFERARLEGYEDVIAKRIQNRIHSDLMALSGTEVYATTAMNTVFSDAYGRRLDLDYVQKRKDGQLDDYYILNINDGLAHVRFDNDLTNNATVYAQYIDQYRAEEAQQSLFNTRYNSRNMAIPIRNDALYGLDPDVTSYTSSIQGASRYLTKGTKVIDGKLVPLGATFDPQTGKVDYSTSIPTQSAFMDSDLMKASQYDPPDRQGMVHSNFNDSLAVTTANVSQMSCGGWNYEDAFVVSKDFAMKNMIPNESGKARWLQGGDKLCDAHGNKGVISLVVDRNWDEIEARDRGAYIPWKIMKENPSLDIIEPPYSSLSRQSAGIFLESQDENGVQDNLRHLDGSTTGGGIIRLNMIITDKTSEEKTSIYGPKEVAAGKGRSASSQLSWVLSGMQAHNIMAEIYADNDDGLDRLIGTSKVLGVEMDMAGNIYKKPAVDTLKDTDFVVEGYFDEVGGTKNRNKNGKFKKLGKPLLDESGNQVLDEFGSKKLVRESDMMKIFSKALDEKESMIIPFDLQTASGSGLTKVVDDEGVLIGYRLPILSPSLRNGYRLEDGRRIDHEYTGFYRNIYRSAMYASDLVRKGEAGKNETSIDATEFKNCQGEAQKQFSKISSSIEKQNLSEKYNAARAGVMANRLVDSATVVWGPNPNLRLEEMVIPQNIAKRLHIEDGETVLSWRDPVLRPAGVYAFKAKIDKEATALMVNPVVANIADGDFDGDTVALVKLHSEAAREEADKLFGVHNKLLEYGYRNEDGSRDWCINTSKDITKAMQLNPQLKEDFDKLLELVNNADKDKDNPNRQEVLKSLCTQLGSVVHSAFETCKDSDAISYTNYTEHVESVKRVCLDGQGKSENEDFKTYQVRALYEQDKTEGIKDQIYELNQVGKEACAIKTFCTGVAGTYSQRGMKVGIEKAPLAIMETSRPNTQAMVSSKHDAQAASIRKDFLYGVGRSIWNGQAIEQDGNVWKAVKDENGEAKMLNHEQWVEQIGAAYTAPTSEGGMGTYLDKEYLEQIATMMSDQTGQIIGIENMRGPALTELAYGANAKTLVMLAEDGKNLFDGQMRHYASITSRGLIGQVKPPEIKVTLDYDKGISNTKPLQKLSDKELEGIAKQNSQVLDNAKIVKKAENQNLNDFEKYLSQSAAYEEEHSDEFRRSQLQSKAAGQRVSLPEYNPSLGYAGHNSMMGSTQHGLDENL